MLFAVNAFRSDVLGDLVCFNKSVIAEYDIVLLVVRVQICATLDDRPPTHSSERTKCTFFDHIAHSVASPRK